jgi:hypothetical protein
VLVTLLVLWVVVVPAFTLAGTYIWSSVLARIGAGEAKALPVQSASLVRARAERRSDREIIMPAARAAERSPSADVRPAGYSPRRLNT